MTGTARLNAESPQPARVVPTGGRRRAEHLALLGLAMIAGAIGFLFVIFWGIALILMGILWGMMAMERQRLGEPDKGVLAEVVDVVVDAAKDAVHVGSRHGDAHGDVHDPPPSGNEPAPEPVTRRRITSSRSHPFP